jgi:FAD synthetase
MKTVMAFGTFDLLHPGHLHYLAQARALGDRLVVVVGRDESVRRIKGKAPLLRERDRLLVVKGLRSVDEAVLGNSIRNSEDAFGIIRRYRPDVIALGHDQWAGVGSLRRWLAANGMRARVVRLRSPLKRSVYSSSRIRRALGSSRNSS